MTVRIVFESAKTLENPHANISKDILGIEWRGIVARSNSHAACNSINNWSGFLEQAIEVFLSLILVCRVQIRKQLFINPTRLILLSKRGIHSGARFVAVLSHSDDRALSVWSPCMRNKPLRFT